MLICYEIIKHNGAIKIEVPNPDSEVKWYWYYGYSLKEAIKLWRKDFNLKGKHISFIKL